MFNLRKLSIMGLALCATAAGATAPGFATLSSAAPATPTISVAAQVSSSPVPGTYGQVVLHHLTLHITGSGFDPGSRVRLAVMKTAPWELVAKVSIYAQDAVIHAVIPGECRIGLDVCSQPNPRAGTIDYHMRFSSVPAASTLLVLYRSARLTGMHNVAL